MKPRLFQTIQLFSCYAAAMFILKTQTISAPVEFRILAGIFFCAIVSTNYLYDAAESLYVISKQLEQKEKKK